MVLAASVPSYIKSITPYKPGMSIDELKKHKTAQISKLASNENPYGPSPLVLDEMKKALSEIYYYPDMHSIELKQAIAKFYGLKREEIALGNGSEGILALIARAFLLPGEKVLTAEDTFIGISIVIKATGADVMMTPQTRDYRFDVEKLKDNLNPTIKLLYIANPNNPTGTYINRKEWEYLMDYVPPSTLVIMDEAYFEFARENGDYPDSLSNRYDNIITLRTFSKAYGMAGIRVGYAVADPEIIETLDKVRPAFETNLLAQRGAIAALNDSAHLQKIISNNKEQHKRTFDFLMEKKLSPATSACATNFICFKTGSLEASKWMFEQLLQKGVVIRPLLGSKIPDHIRVSLGTKKQMDHFCSSLEEILPFYYKNFGKNHG